MGGSPSHGFVSQLNRQGGDHLARSNYQFNKRQKELARMKKKAEKRQRRLDKKAAKPDETSFDVQDDEVDSSA
jgi:uncharacterized protein (DUF3084 family)